jgi:hypothetical protein
MPQPITSTPKTRSSNGLGIVADAPLQPPNSRLICLRASKRGWSGPVSSAGARNDRAAGCGARVRALARFTWPYGLRGFINDSEQRPAAVNLKDLKGVPIIGVRARAHDTSVIDSRFISFSAMRVDKFPEVVLQRILDAMGTPRKALRPRRASTPDGTAGRYARATGSWKGFKAIAPVRPIQLVRFP